MRKIPVYICNRKRCENGTCDLCHNTTDINFAEQDENGEPIVSYYINWNELPFNYPGDIRSSFMEVEK